jgi:hypothetical protein
VIRQIRPAAIFLAASTILLSSVAAAQVYDSSAFAGLRWREIGPFRGGRSVAVAGSPCSPDGVLLRHNRRRSLQDDGRRNDVGARLPTSTSAVRSEPST